MIDPKELRIGNWVKCNQENGQEFDCKIQAEDFKLLVDSDEYRKNHHPLPLTEEWLERFGFKNIDSGAPHLDISDNSRIVCPVKNTDRWLYIETSQEDENMYSNLTHIFTMNNYVHQLQNLYFILTGEELKLK